MRCVVRNTLMWHCDMVRPRLSEVGVRNYQLMKNGSERHPLATQPQSFSIEGNGATRYDHFHLARPCHHGVRVRCSTRK